ncbi:MAG: hypothetical protein M9962_14065 [Oligoflexia bacterium]|nr:hypothetical protein [Oligoflexia bacterium]
MKTLKLALITALSLPAVVVAAEDPLKGLKVETSPYESCQDVSLLSSSIYNKDKEYWDDAIAECGIDVQVIPDPGFFKSFVTAIGEGEKGKEKTINFLSAVGQKAIQYTQDNLKINEVFVNCAKGNQSWFAEQAKKDPKNAESLYDFNKCEALLSNVREMVKEKGPQLRLEREVMQKNRNRWEGFKSFMTNVGETVGLDLKAPSDRIPAEPEVLKQSEEIHAQEMKVIEDGFQEEITKNMAIVEANRKKLGANADMIAMRQERMEGTPTWFQGWYTETEGGKRPNSRTARPYKDMVTVNKIQENHMGHVAKYMGIIQEAPVLAYLSSDNPSNEDLATAGEEIARNARDEIKKIQETISAVRDGKNYMTDANGKKVAVGDMSESEKSDLMLDFVRYGSVIREMLKENPGYCGPATGLANYLVNSDLRRYSYLAPAMVAGGIIGWGARGLAAAGFAISTVATDALVAGVFAVPLVPIYKNDYEKYQSLKQKTFSLIDTSNQYEIDGRLTTGMSVAEVKEYTEARDQFAMTLALLPLDAIGFGAYKGTASMLTRALDKRGFLKALQKSGFSQAEVQALKAQIKSENPGVVRRALMRIKSQLGIPDDMLNFLKVASDKNLVKLEDQASLDRIVKVLGDVPRKDRTAFMGNFGRLLKELNTAKVNTGNRSQIIDLFANASKVGVSDPKRIAAIAVDWDEGLDGLSRVFDLAAKRMDDPSIRTIASVTQRQEQAFKSALYDSLPEDMPPAQRNKLVGEMCSCPGMCPVK